MEDYDIEQGNLGTYYLKKGTNIFHRLEGPAIEYIDGTKEWWVDGKRHRIDGPAVEHPNGDKEWYVDGKNHRLDGPAWERNGYEEWIVNGKTHRENGPAVIYPDGSKQWWFDDKLHRLDGPAYEDPFGYNEWSINGVRLSPEKEAIMNIWYKNGRALH